MDLSYALLLASVFLPLVSPTLVFLLGRKWLLAIRIVIVSTLAVVPITVLVLLSECGSYSRGQTSILFLCLGFAPVCIAHLIKKKTWNVKRILKGLLVCLIITALVVVIGAGFILMTIYPLTVLVYCFSLVTSDLKRNWKGSKFMSLLLCIWMLILIVFSLQNLMAGNMLVTCGYHIPLQVENTVVF